MESVFAKVKGRGGRSAILVFLLVTVFAFAFVFVNVFFFIPNLHQQRRVGLSSRLAGLQLLL